MPDSLPGLHHMTALCSDAQRNIDFYVGVLGLRLVKKTVNFDDPGTYHLYYGDGRGTPGTLLTFFAWPGAHRGRHGLGQVTATALTIPGTALDYWQARLIENNVPLQKTETRFGQQVLTFADPDGLILELITRSETTSASDGYWADSPIPSEYAIRRLDGVSLTVAHGESSAVMLNALGFRLVGEENGRARYTTANGESGTIADLLVDTEAPRANLGVGVVHHVAWRTPNDATELIWRAKIKERGYSVSPVMDRDYFHSIYFTEPGGVLFEIATDPPGFTVDESLETLGTRLCLPAGLEESRPLLEAALPGLYLPVNKK
jgi:glyoxalase family protein